MKLEVGPLEQLEDRMAVLVVEQDMLLRRVGSRTPSTTLIDGCLEDGISRGAKAHLKHVLAAHCRRYGVAV